MNTLNSMNNALFNKQNTDIKKYNTYNKNKPKIISKTFDNMLNKKLNHNKSIDEKKLNPTEKKLYKTCVELESFFWKQVLNSMKKTTGKYKLLDGGQAEEIFSDFLYDEYSMIMSKNSNTGISTSIFKQLAINLQS